MAVWRVASSGDLKAGSMVLMKAGVKAASKADVKVDLMAATKVV